MKYKVGDKVTNGEGQQGEVISVKGEAPLSVLVLYRIDVGDIVDSYTKKGWYTAIGPQGNLDLVRPPKRKKMVRWAVVSDHAVVHVRGTIALHTSKEAAEVWRDREYSAFKVVKVKI